MHPLLKAANDNLRDAFAMEAMKLMLNLDTQLVMHGRSGVFDAIDCYAIADAMMAAREEKEDKNESHG